MNNSDRIGVDLVRIYNFLIGDPVFRLPILNQFWQYCIQLKLVLYAYCTSYFMLAWFFRFSDLGS